MPRRLKANKSKKRALELEEDLVLMIGGLPDAFPTQRTRVVPGSTTGTS